MRVMRQWEFNFDLRGKVQSGSPTSLETEDAWAMVEEDYRSLAVTFHSLFEQGKPETPTRPFWAPRILPTYLRRLLPFSDGWYHSPEIAVPRRVERWEEWNLFQRPAEPERRLRDELSTSHYYDARHVFPLGGEHRLQMFSLWKRIVERALMRTSEGRAEPLLAKAIADADAELSALRLSGERVFNHTANRFLPVLAGTPTHDEQTIRNDTWSFGEEEWNTKTAERRALVRRLLWLRRWHELEADLGRALRRPRSYPRFALNDFTAYIKPEEIVQSYNIFEAAIEEREVQVGEFPPNIRAMYIRHYDPIICLGHWYRTMLYQCGASWRDLHGIARRSDRRHGFQLGLTDGKRQDAQARRRTVRAIYGPYAASGPDVGDYDVGAWSPQYQRAEQLWVARRHLARWGRMAMQRVPKNWEG